MSVKSGGKKQARYIFTQLVQPISQEKSGEVRQIATRKIATFADIGKENWQLVIKFADERLVVTNKEKDVVSVELIHEVLITAWSRLKNWIEQDWEFRRWQEKLRDNLSQWEQEKKADFLLQGGLLKEAESWLEKGEQKIPEKERGYVEKSRKRRERERQKVIGGLTGGLVMVSLFAVGMVWQWQSAERQSLINEVDSLSNLALNQFQSGEGGISALMTAMDAGQKLKKLVKDDENFGNYPTTQPLLALQTITSNIREKNEFQSENLGVTEGFRQAFFTPDSKHIVSSSITAGGGYSRVIIWNLKGEKVTEWEIPGREAINNLAISPNGKYIATTAGREGKFYIWDFSGKKIAESSEWVNGYFIVKFTPDSQYIAVTSTLKAEVDFFDLSGKKIKEFKIDGGGTIYSLEFTPNGEEIIIGNAVGVVQLWNLKTSEKIREFKANTNQVLEINISPDGKRLLTLGVDINSATKTAGLGARLWDLSGKKIVDFGFFPRIDTYSYGDFTFSPDGQQIGALLPNQRVVNFYNTLSGKLIAQSAIGAGYNNELIYSPDSKIIALPGIDGIKLLSNKTKSDFIELPANYGYKGSHQVELPGFTDVNYSADGQKIVVIDKHYYYVDIWDWQQKEKIRINYGYFTENEAWSSYFTSGNFFEKALFASMTPDSKFIILVTKEGIKKLDLEANLISQLKTNVNSDESLLQTKFFGKKHINGVVLTDVNYSSNFDGSKIATIGITRSPENTIRLWDLYTQKVKQFKHNSLSRIISQVLVSPNGEYILTNSSARGKLWDASGNLLNSLDINAKKSTLKGEEVSILPILLDVKKQKVAFREHGVKILVVWQNSTADKAGLRSGDIILEIDGKKVDDFEEIGDFNLLLKGEPGTPIKIKLQNRNHKIEEKTILREKVILDVSNLFLFPGNRAKFSPDSKYLATWDTGSKNLSFRNIKTKKLVEINHQAGILGVHFSPDSQLLATMGMDYSIKFWDFSGNLINQIKFQQIPFSMTFSPDSQQIAVLGDSNELSIWSINGKQIAKYTVPEEQGNIVFSPDGKYIATGQSKVFIWQNKNLNELLATGCDWLQEYLTTRPQEKEKLKVCQEEVK
ncbi:MAG: WD40 repeat domain-containing protein [Okeania sp. SIO2C9]|uniref:WD40 repeat domain-containing protein n=1 Tax=Okeania sp. SIO2C9 TaxID=2607791 RepID=UPI0013BEF1F3|nr:WD40 repeat domain-containing protein [Okeania sp. SIO2C9]NEQ71887.1 WD40 repeat domain-containing protein [Okeania sp. SIO2C9]